MSLLGIETGKKTPLTFILAPEDENQKEKEPKKFADILSLSDRKKAINLLKTGGVVAPECLGPFGLMVGIRMDGNISGSERQVDKLGEIKGRDMKDQPAPFFAPASMLDNFIDYEAMTRSGYIRLPQVKTILKPTMIRSGAFFEVALKPPLDSIIPYTRIAVVNKEAPKKPVKTGIVACLDESYPALAEMVKKLWVEKMIPLITSANLSGRQDTLTTAREVWQTFGKDYPDLMILDNPRLKKALDILGVEQSSYTLTYFTTGWRAGKENEVEFGRQGNVDPEWIVELLNQGLSNNMFVRGQTRKILADNPFFDLEMARGYGGKPPENGKEPFAIGPHIYEILRPVLNGS